jgi:hypothetical protein
MSGEVGRPNSTLKVRLRTRNRRRWRVGRTAVEPKAKEWARQFVIEEIRSRGLSQDSPTPS